MVNLASKRALIARALGVGKDRVWIDPEHIEEVMDIDTREDVRRLLKQGVIKVKPVKGQTIRERKKRRGPGSRKGAKYSRISKKRLWIMRVRAQRKFLRMLRDKGVLTRSQYRKLYMMVKGGMFRSKAHLREYIRQHVLGEQAARQGG